MTNDAEAQEIQGTVVSSGRFPEPAAEDRTEPAEAADQDEVSDPEDEEDEERDDDTDPGYRPLAADRADDGEVVDPDAVIVDQTDDPDAVIVDQTDEPPADDEAPEPVAGFVRTPVASSESVTPADASGPEASAENAETDADAEQDAAEPTASTALGAGASTDEADPDAEQEAAEADAGSVGTTATIVTVAGADAVPEADVIAEAARPGVPANGEVPAMSGLAGDPEQLHEQWSAIQSSFVDDPRAAVAAAAELVSDAIARLVASAQERERGLRGEWDRDGADTEDLRNTLRGYRGLLDQLAGL